MIHNRLRELRGKQTQEYIAQCLELSRSRYSHYENGRREPDIEVLKRMADFFCVSTDYLLGRTAIPHYPAAFKKSNQASNDVNLHLLIEQIINASEEQQQQLWETWEIIKSDTNNKRVTKDKQ